LVVVVLGGGAAALTFSCTVLSGYEAIRFILINMRLNSTSSSSASSLRVDGSGTGPSIVHRFESYFVRIKFSILLWSSSVNKPWRSPPVKLTPLQGHDLVPTLLPSICISREHYVQSVH
jgi:hypothetical protein